jgi:uncharacterized membrane protein YjgN (DUF898 family)
VNDEQSVLPATSAFVFTGRASVYFRIWAVSLLLSILSLGIYSAWGKVRKKRYLYAHTILDGTGFEYRASPLAILRGRVIAVALFGGFALSGHFVRGMQAVFVLLLLLLLPWIVVAAARFNARNSAWRNITFGFDGTIGEAAKIFLGLGALAIVTLGFGYPYFKMRRTRFIIARHHFGTTRLEADIAAGGFIVTYLLAVLMTIGLVVLVVVATIVEAMLSRAASHAAPNQIVFLSDMALSYAGYIAVYAYVRARLGNLTFNAIVAGPLRCRSRLRARDMVWLYITNVLAILGTVGLAAPWVTVRMARYRINRLRLVGSTTPEVYMGARRETSSATGSEVSDLFDVDVSL